MFLFSKLPSTAIALYGFFPPFIHHKAVFKVISVFCSNTFSFLYLLGMSDMEKGSII